MYFDTKSYLKSTRNHTVKHVLIQIGTIELFFYSSQENQAAFHMLLNL